MDRQTFSSAQTTRLQADVAEWTSPWRQAWHICHAKRSVAPLVLLAAWCATDSAYPQNLTGQLNVHDPSSVIELNGRYYLFYTGTRVRLEILRRSDELDRGAARIRIAARLDIAVGTRQHGKLLGTRRRVLQQPVSFVLLGLDFRQSRIRHRPGHQSDARSERSCLPMDRPRAGHRVERRFALQHDRSQYHSDVEQAKSG